MSNNIEEQLAHLRSSLRRQRVFNLALVGTAIAATTVAAVRPASDVTFDTVTCKKWKVVDDDGKTRISAGTKADGRASVTWYDKDSKERIKAGTWADGTANLPTIDLKPKP